MCLLQQACFSIKQRESVVHGIGARDRVRVAPVILQPPAHTEALGKSEKDNKKTREFIQDLPCPECYRRSRIMLPACSQWTAYKRNRAQCAAATAFDDGPPTAYFSSRFLHLQSVHLQSAPQVHPLSTMASTVKKRSVVAVFNKMGMVVVGRLLAGCGQAGRAARRYLCVLEGSPQFEWREAGESD